MDATNVPKIDAEEILEGILEWVEIETPTYEADAVNALADVVEENLEAIGTEILRIPGRDGFGDILRARSPWGGEGPGILVLSHLDTVHPFGTKDGKNAIRREGDSVYGPGIYDMKGGAHLAYYAYRHLVRQGKETKLPITFLYIPEEEIGSPTSRATIEEEAKKNKYVLVTEPAREGGKCVTARKGVGRFDIRITGQPSHSGSKHEDGRSAILEMARQIVAIEAMTDYQRGITTNVGQVKGGTAVNVRPAECTAEVDLRVLDEATADEMYEKIVGLKPFDDDVEMEITGEINRPPYQKDEAIAALYEHARELAAEIGFELGDLLTGGGSDGNFTAALGIPTLDGLGADGVGAHTHFEQIYVSRLEPQAKLWVRLLETLE
ncbi:MAG: M20 family metallopeptidase [Alphaproteobacteria bacterium]|jgi:glutamate carboxypeptidase|nr:M20 family metallopeptidase [Alphaproteobacteria bacterium]